MDQNTARQTAIEGHRERAARAARDLDYAQQAPALFKPEWTERAETELANARRAALAVSR